MATPLHAGAATPAPDPQPVWAAYRALVAAEAARPPAAWTFKGDPVYRQFLEHTTPEQGEAYLTLLRAAPDWTIETERRVQMLARTNDSLGAPIPAPSSLGLACSPANLRYAWQAWALWQHVRALGLHGIHILELGGGYGGLALFAHWLAPLLHVAVRSHTLVDLPEVTLLQGEYCRALDLPVGVVDGTYAPGLALAVASARPGVRVFVSCYGFGEFPPAAQRWYHQRLARHCPHGFVLWNWTKPYPLVDARRAPQTIVDEPVFTEPGTKVVTYEKMAEPTVHLIVFSKDRPLQLHGYLTSLFAQWHGGLVVDVLAWVRPPFTHAYRAVADAFGGRIVFWPEARFGADVPQLLALSPSPLTCFGCDDAVFVAPVDAALLLPLFEADPKLLGVSLRLGNTVKRGMWGHEMAQPRFVSGLYEARETHPAALEWDCTAIGSAGDWAYPWDVVGTVYRTDFVRRMVGRIHGFGGLTNPSQLEYHGSCRWQEEAEGKTLLRAWHRPRLVLPTVNVVQSEFPNGTVGDDRLTPEFLLECWNRGLRLDTQRYATAPQPDTWRTGDLYLRRAA